MTEGHTVHALVNPNHRYRPAIDTALILSPDPLGAVLVAAAAELAGLRAAFAGTDESPKAALRRVRPIVALIDVEASCASDSAFLGPAKMTGACLVVFGRARQLEQVANFIGQYGATVLVFPQDAPDIVRRLRQALESSLRQPESTAR